MGPPKVDRLAQKVDFLNLTTIVPPTKTPFWFTLWLKRTFWQIWGGASKEDVVIIMLQV